MAIGEIEKSILLCIARNRSTESYLAGATVLNASDSAPRTSEDLDIFNDPHVDVREVAQKDIKILQQEGYEIEVTRDAPAFFQALVKKNSESTHIDWAQESSFRFFPVEADATCGWRLNFFDAATNKIIALVQRNVVRDVVDAAELHENYLSLGALAWAAAAKDPGLTPEWIIDFALRTHRHSLEEWQSLKTTRQIDPKEWSMLFRDACYEAKELHKRLNPIYLGCLFLDAEGKPTTPIDDGSSYRRQFAKNRGVLPRPSNEER